MKKNTDSPSTVALKIDRKDRMVSPLHPNKNVWTPVRRDETTHTHIYTHTPCMTPHPTRRWEFASRRNSRNNSLCGRAEGAAESGIREDLVVFRKGTGNRDIHGVVDDPCKSFGAEFGEGGRERKDVMLMRRDATQRGAAASRGRSVPPSPDLYIK